MYTADSLEAIAKHFTEMANRASERSLNSATIKEKHLLGREALIWGQAASMLRQTTLKGGTPASPEGPTP